MIFRLPVAGIRADSKETQKSLQTTPSGSKSNLSTPSSVKQEMNTSKRSSFVEVYSGHNYVYIMILE